MLMKLLEKQSFESLGRDKIPELLMDLVLDSAIGHDTVVNCNVKYRKPSSEPTSKNTSNN